MTNPHLSINWLLAAPLATVFGFGPLDAAYAQSTATSTMTDAPSSSSSYLVPGGNLMSGILPPAGHNSLGRYISGRTTYGIQISPDDTNNTDDAGQVWLELNGQTTDRNGMSAQVGLGYAPTPDVGIAVGPFVDLSGSRSDNFGAYEAGSYEHQTRSSRIMLSDGSSGFDDAGFAASLSFMPLEDIWIGLHGSVSHSLTPSETHQGMLDGIDAMLGLTARYRIEF